MFSVHSFAKGTSKQDEDAQLHAQKILYEDCLQEVIASSADSSSQFETNVRLSISRICGELESGPKELHEIETQEEQVKASIDKIAEDKRCHYELQTTNCILLK